VLMEGGRTARRLVINYVVDKSQW